MNQFCWKTEIAIHRNDSTPEAGKLVLFDPSINSLNLGDKIILHYCSLAIAELFEKNETFYVPTHTLPSDAQLREIRKSEIKIVCGTNLITPHYEEFSNWKMPRNLSGYRDIITLGVGWGYYCNEISKTSKFVYHNILSATALHSVRDSYTEGKFKAMGIENVLNTGCPSIWGLTQQHCMGIPQKKARNVVTTLTDYAPDAVADHEMLSILLQNYENVFVWLQGCGDRLCPGFPYRVPIKKGKKNACTYCPYSRVCGFDMEIPGYEFRRLKNFTDEELWNAFAKEVK